MRKGKVMRPFRPPRQSVEKKSVCGASDSAEPTEFGLVRGSSIVKKTQELGYETTKDYIETVLGNVEVLPNQNLKTTVPSPNVLDFENYLDGLHSMQDSRAAASSVDSMAVSSQLPETRPAHMTKDEWWESVLRAERARVQKLEQSHLAPVEEMFLDPVSSDDDIPIVNTLPPTPAKAKKKKKVNTLWSYETVAEPTGIRSKYWDAQASTERATKQLV
jgi:hypothetical protein